MPTRVDLQGRIIRVRTRVPDTIISVAWPDMGPGAEVELRFSFRPWFPQIPTAGVIRVVGTLLGHCVNVETILPQDNEPESFCRPFQSHPFHRQVERTEILQIVRLQGATDVMLMEGGFRVYDDDVRLLQSAALESGQIIAGHVWYDYIRRVYEMRRITTLMNGIAFDASEISVDSLMMLEDLFDDLEEFSQDKKMNTLRRKQLADFVQRLGEVLKLEGRVLQEKKRKRRKRPRVAPLPAREPATFVIPEGFGIPLEEALAPVDEPAFGNMTDIVEHFQDNAGNRFTLEVVEGRRLITLYAPGLPVRSCRLDIIIAGHRFAAIPCIGQQVQFTGAAADLLYPHLRQGQWGQVIVMAVAEDPPYFEQPPGFVTVVDWTSANDQIGRATNFSGPANPSLRALDPS